MQVDVKILGLTLLAGLAAGVIPVQAIVNGRLGQLLGNPLLAALISFATGTCVLILLLLTTTPGLPAWPAKTAIPWYLLTGGVYGVIFVTLVVILVPQIGTGNLIAATVAGQLIMAVLIDHFAMLGVPQHSISLTRLAGCALLLGGLWLVQLK